MRIISGKHKGFRFPKRNMPHARPTTDRAKESLFNILNQSYDLEEVMILDLYGGLGSMAFEFYSRGAQVTTVEVNRKSISYIIDIAKNLGADITIKQAKVLQFLKRETSRYDIIFADPPYNAGSEIQKLVTSISEGDYLKEAGLFILEHQSMTQVKHPAISEIREYGQSSFSFFKFADNDE